MNKGVMQYFILGIFLIISIIIVSYIGGGINPIITGSVILDSKAPIFLPLEKEQTIPPEELGVIWEDKCTADCLAQINKDLVCKSFDKQETNEICKKCSQICIKGYKGPCLLNEQLRIKKTECLFKNMELKLISGDSNKGYMCIVDATCSQIPAVQDSTKESQSKKPTEELIKFLRDIILWKLFYTNP